MSQNYLQKWKCLHEQCQFETDNPREAAFHCMEKENSGHAVAEA